ncbi:MAG: carbon monoxide dehydrogenase subunit G [Rhodobiaceae bacterium]|jgi:carbon monoxide dehydrogenase subunit G|nr:carbon monoxide dehydrogenase subunit G [Rhodobiaceae bacterium]|tara:strand:- start:1466 stop:2062 length:597 start_codon:yes stop_codon:yes gene_type:complete
MKLSGSNIILAQRQLVWDALNDPDVLKDTIPGAQSVTQTNKDEFEAVVEAKVGPVKAKFTGKIKLTDIDPPNGYKISGQGQGGAAGFAKGSAEVNLIDNEDQTTTLNYTVDAQIGGKLAQIGQRLVQSTAISLSEQFFDNLSKRFVEDTVGEIEEDNKVALKDKNYILNLFNSSGIKVKFILGILLLSLAMSIFIYVR